jgi:hypothetical protein
MKNINNSSDKETIKFITKKKKKTNKLPTITSLLPIKKFSLNRLKK